jgi:hypothetical protein
MLTPYTLNEFENNQSINWSLAPMLAQNWPYAYVSGLFTRDDFIVTDKQRNGANRNVNDWVSNSIYGDDMVCITNNSDVSMIYETSSDPAYILQRKGELGMHGGDTPDKVGHSLKPVYSSVHLLSNVIQLTENSRRDDSLDTLVKYVVDNDKSNVRKTIQNIIDLNLVPLSVHALQREIPLANLYNYAYTFDRIITELYYGKNLTSEQLKQLCGDQDKLPCNSSLDLLVKSLINPYMPFDWQNIVHVKQMMLGLPLAGELGRPKFLSDQIFGKVIFGDLLSPLLNPTEEKRNLGPVHSQDDMAERIAAVINYISERAVLPMVTVTWSVADPVRQKKIIDRGAHFLVENQHASIKEIIDDIASFYPPPRLAPAEDELIMVARLVKYVGTVALYMYGLMIQGLTPNADDGNCITQLLNSISYNLTGPGEILYIDNNIGSNIAKYITSNKAKFTDSLINNVNNVPIQPMNLGGNVTLLQDAIQANEPRLYSNELVYYDSNNKINTILLSGAVRAELVVNGTNRLNTILIRNIIFIVNAYRSVRLKLQRDLNYSKDIIRSSIPITNDELTEFTGYQQQSSRSEYPENDRHGTHKRYTK